MPFPRRGEVYDYDFSPTRGSEQGGVRPAVVVSNDVANEHSTIVVVVPCTHTIPRKQYPQNAPLPAGIIGDEPGTVFCNQPLTVSKERLKDFRGALPADVMDNVDNALRVALDL